MTKSEWIKKYEDKAEPYYELEPEGYTELFDPEKGYLYYKIEGNCITIGHCCTNDMYYWEKRVQEIANKYGCTTIKTITMRNPRAYIRMTGAHLDLINSGYRPNGLWYWAMERGVNRKERE